MQEYAIDRLETGCLECAQLRDFEGEIKYMTMCTDCGAPVAIWHLHSVPDPREARSKLTAFLLGEVDEHGWRGRIEMSSVVGHLTAHFRSERVPYKTIPQPLADALAFETQRAVKWFWDPNDVYLGDLSVREISDEEVDWRILGMMYAMDKEVARYSKGEAGFTSFNKINPHTYEGYDAWIAKWEEFRQSADFEPQVATRESGVPTDEFRDNVRYTGNPLRIELRALPYERQRALVQNWERIWTDYVKEHELEWDLLGFKSHALDSSDARSTSSESTSSEFYYD